MPQRAPPQFKVDTKLVLAAPAHSGLPTGGTAIVRRVRFDDETKCWLYDVLLSGGGETGTEVRFADSVCEGWLRHEGRIATAKSCAPMTFGAVVRLEPRMIVPLFQRRYCWERPQWLMLWQDVVSPPGFGAHSIGRMTIARAPRALLVVDGQQRCTTLMLLLCALRDVAIAHCGASAAPLVHKIEATLTSRSRKLQHSSGSSSGSSSESALLRHAGVGLETLDEASTVRFIPSRADRLPFCCLVLRRPYDPEGSKAAAKMCQCHRTFYEHAIELLRKQVFGFDPQASTGFGIDRSEARAAPPSPPPTPAGLPSQRAGEPAAPCRTPRMPSQPSPPAQPQTAAVQPMDAARDQQCVEALAKVAESVLTRVSLVVFELQDGVALQSMYDMLAQRERAINRMFANVGGRSMGDVDLVRNHLLDHIDDDDERIEAYESLWLPMERAHGDGDATVLERFLHSFVRHALSASEEGSALLMGPPPPRTANAAKHALEDASVREPGSLMESVAALLRKRGGNNGVVSLFAHGTAAADAAAPVEKAAAKGAAMQLLKDMCAAATTAGGAVHSGAVNAGAVHAEAVTSARGARP